MYRCACILNTCVVDIYINIFSCQFPKFLLFMFIVTFPEEKKINFWIEHGVLVMWNSYSYLRDHMVALWDHKWKCCLCEFVFLCSRPWLHWLEWSHIYAVCHWGWMRDGIQSNQILLILPEEHMEQTMLRHS